MPSFPKIDLPKIEVPTLPKFDLPEVEVPTVEQLVGCARNVVYVGVGLAVTTVERVQEWQRRFVDAVKDGVAKIRPAA